MVPSCIILEIKKLFSNLKIREAIFIKIISVRAVSGTKKEQNLFSTHSVCSTYRLIFLSSGHTSHLKRIVSVKQ